MKQKKLFAAILAAVLCFAGVLAGCKAGTFDKIEQAYLSGPGEDGAQTALLRRSEETALVDEAIAFVKDVPFEALDEAEAEALWEKLLARYNDGRRKTLFNTAVYLLPLEDLRSVMAYWPAGRNWLSNP